MEASARLRSLVVSFGERAVLDARDHAVIRSLGLRFRGRTAWPWLRSQRPGYAPWYLEGDECRLLELALIQGADVSKRVRDGTLQLTTGLDESPMLTRCYRADQWIDEWRKPEALDVAPDEPGPVDEVRLRRLQTSRSRKIGAWQLDLAFLPTPIGTTGERPYYPRLLLALADSGLIVGTQMLEPWSSAAELQEAMLTLLEEAEHLPGDILVSRDEVLRLIAPLAKALKIRVHLTELPELEEVRESLLDYLER